jgi:hypothetical protein
MVCDVLVWCMLYAVCCMLYGVYCRVYAVWRMAYGVWCMLYGVWRMVYGACCMAHVVWRMLYGVWRMAHGVWRMLYCVCCTVYAVPYLQCGREHQCRLPPGLATCRFGSNGHIGTKRQYAQVRSCMGQFILIINSNLLFTGIYHRILTVCGHYASTHRLWTLCVYSPSVDMHLLTVCAHHASTHRLWTCDGESQYREGVPPPSPSGRCEFRPGVIA